LRIAPAIQDCVYVHARRFEQVIDREWKTLTEHAVKPVRGLVNARVNGQGANIGLNAIEEIVAKPGSVPFVKSPTHPQIFFGGFK